ncbi:hypothetical protein [uncultured Adlercreutzia sp.]|nr:hypothetical protein [uncultured Adlercreutzia sp.]
MRGPFLVWDCGCSAYVKSGISKRSELRPLLERQSAGTPHALYFEKK